MSAIMLASHQNSSLLLTMVNPAGHQTLSPDMVKNGLACIANAERDESIRSIIICGSGNDFCRGRDRHALVPQSGQLRNPEHELTQINLWIEAIRNCSKPVIAAVEGMAQDAGFALALACDFIIAANSAQFSCSLVKLGLSPDGGISWLLTRALPRQLVSELLFEGKPILAARLHQLGLVKQVVVDGSTQDAALRFAARLADLPPMALERIKNLIQEASVNSFSQHLEAEQHAFLEGLHHHEAEEGITAFLEQRKPRF